MQAAIKYDEEKVNLKRSFVYVAEEDGQVVAFAAARLVWIVEPLKIVGGRKPKSTLRRAVYGLAKEMEGFMTDRQRNQTGIHEYFAHVRKHAFRELCEHWGLSRWYPGTRLYHKIL